MGSERKLELVKDSLRYLTKILNERDRISIVCFDHESYFTLPWTLNNVENKIKIKSAIVYMSTGGSTNISSGVDKGLNILIYALYSSIIAVK